MYNLGNNTRTLTEGISLIIFCLSLGANEIARRHGQLFFRFAIPVLLFMAYSICLYYQRQSSYLPLGYSISRTVGEMDIFYMFGSLLCIFGVPALLYLIYNPSYYSDSWTTMLLLSIAVLALSFINGFIMSYYNSTYKQNMKKFNFISILRWILAVSIFIPIAVEAYYGNFLIFMFPVMFMYVLGVFFKAFNKKHKGVISYCFFLLIFVSMAYFAFDVSERMSYINLFS